MKIEVVVVGDYQTNCYILKQNGEALIIDPGSEVEKIKSSIGANKVVGVLLTHRHEDHIGALTEIVNEYSVPVYEKENLEEKEYTVGTFSFSVLFTPGHTKDSVTYQFLNGALLFVGDFLFFRSIGRMDLGGNFLDMNKSIERMKQYQQAHLNLDIKIFPGHGVSTTLLEEIQFNPYFNEKRG